MKFEKKLQNYLFMAMIPTYYLFLDFLMRILKNWNLDKRIISITAEFQSNCYRIICSEHFREDDYLESPMRKKNI